MQSLADVEAIVRKKYEKEHLNRLDHIIGVVKMAKYLARCYNVDENKAQIAAWMHDYCKYDSFDDASKYLNDADLLECKKYPFLFHAYLSAEKYKEMGGVDNEIYMAIRNHVFGRPHMSMLEEIVMIADYTEENRKYASCVECRKILLGGNLHKAIVYSLEKTIEHIKEEGQVPHKGQLAVLNEYKEIIKL